VGARRLCRRVPGATPVDLVEVGAVAFSLHLDLTDETRRAALNTKAQAVLVGRTIE
jgi:hypothetical protein